MEREKPNFSLATVNPPLVFGPIIHYLNSLDGLNTSNTRLRNLMLGQSKTAIPDTATFLWVDVRDVALAHVRAMDRPEAAGKRFFTTAGNFCHRELADIMLKKFPELQAQLPTKDTPGGGYPDGGVYGFDNSRAKQVLGIDFRSLEACVVDTVKSLQAVGA